MTIFSNCFEIGTPHILYHIAQIQNNMLFLPDAFMQQYLYYRPHIDHNTPHCTAGAVLNISQHAILYCAPTA